MTNAQRLIDELLVLRCQRGDLEARAELVRRFERPLRFYVRRLVGNDTDVWDVLQDTWIKALGGIRHLREPAALSVWLYRVARTAAYSHLRTQPPPAESGTNGSAAAVVPWVEDADRLLRLEAIDRVHAALERLSPAHREVLSLVLLERFSVDEMAAVLGVPAGTVKSRLYHARLAMKAILEEQEATDDRA